MIAFAPAKINIGLRVLSKRPDGFHNLQSYFYPVPLFDIIEFIESNEDHLTQSGLVSTQTMEENLIYHALIELRKYVKIPPLKIHLHKQIPFEAGLGGGSSDAMSFLKSLINKYQPDMEPELILRMAEKIGSDCPFFISSRPSLVEGRGEQVKPVNWSLKDVTICIVKHQLSMSTAEAFKSITPQKASLSDISTVEKQDYKEFFINQFEKNLMNNYQEIREIKERLLSAGSYYASLSGSGSAVFGLFSNKVEIKFPSSYFVWWGQLQ